MPWRWIFRSVWTARASGFPSGSSQALRTGARLDVLAGSARGGAVVASFGLDGIATVQLTEDQLHENHPRNGDANRTTQFSELPTCHAVSSPPLWGELS